MKPKEISFGQRRSSELDGDECVVGAAFYSSYSLHRRPHSDWQLETYKVLMENRSLALIAGLMVTSRQQNRTWCSLLQSAAQSARLHFLDPNPFSWWERMELKLWEAEEGSRAACQHCLYSINYLLKHLYSIFFLSNRVSVGHPYLGCNISNVL